MGEVMRVLEVNEALKDEEILEIEGLNILNDLLQMLNTKKKNL